MIDHELPLKSFALRRAMLHLIVGAGANHTRGGLFNMEISNVHYNLVLNVPPKPFGVPHCDRRMQGNWPHR
jgi:hypothetical protein